MRQLFLSTVLFLALAHVARYVVPWVMKLYWRGRDIELRNKVRKD